MPTPHPPGEQQSGGACRQGNGQIATRDVEFEQEAHHCDGTEGPERRRDHAAVLIGAHAEHASRPSSRYRQRRQPQRAEQDRETRNLDVAGVFQADALTEPHILGQYHSPTNNQHVSDEDVNGILPLPSGAVEYLAWHCHKWRSSCHFLSRGATAVLANLMAMSIH